MDLDNIIRNLDLSIKNIEAIIKNEKFPAYYQIQNLLLETKNLLNSKEFIHAEKNLLTCIRLLMEAPTRNKEIGLDTLTKIDETYKLVTALRIN